MKTLCIAIVDSRSFVRNQNEGGPQNSGPVSKQTRNLWLDVIRFCAFCRVFLLHAVGGVAAIHGTAFLEELTNQLRHGVTCFFVLSGFLMGRKLAKTNFNTSRFIGDRFLRLVPSYWFFLLFMSVAYFSFAGKDKGVMLWGAVWDMLFLSDYLHGAHAHTWAVAVEMKYYLLVAGLGAVLNRYPKWRTHILWTSLVSFYGIGLISRLSSTVSPEISSTVTMFHERLDDFAIGMVAAEISAFPLIRSAKTSRMMLGISMVLMLVVVYFPLNWARQSILAFAFALLILTTSVTRIQSPAFLTYLSGLTYNAYLWHFAVGAICLVIFVHAPGQATPVRILIGLAVGFVMSLATARLMQKWIENPFRAFLVRIYTWCVSAPGAEYRSVELTGGLKQALDKN